MSPFDPIAWDFRSDSRLFVLTGAGVSAESGLRTFRDAGGLWEDQRVEDVATPEGFRRDPELVISFYNKLRRNLPNAQPNAAHRALARLEARLGERLYLVTQNVDDLHERGGSMRVVHMHGELRKLRCRRDPAHVVPFDGDQADDTSCPLCGALMRPHIVWFGEMPLRMDEIEAALSDCTHFAYIGTSSQVYPAAGFRHTAKARGAKVLCINLEVEPDPGTDLFLRGAAGTEVQLWVEGF
jgi:NAD-dependent deacetylase